MRFKGAHFPQDIMLPWVRWYVASLLSPRPIAALRRARGGHVEHCTVHRWVITDRPQLEEACHRRKRPVWVSWRMAEPASKLKGQGSSLSRAVEQTGQPIDGLVPEPRDEPAAQRCLTKARRRQGVPEHLPIAGSAAKAAALKRDQAAHGTAIAIRQLPSLHHRVEQAHRVVKRIPRPMLGFTSCAAAQAPRVGVELMPMIKTRQLGVEAGAEGRTAAEQFSSLAAEAPHR